MIKNKHFILVLSTFCYKNFIEKSCYSALKKTINKLTVLIITIK